MNNPKKGKGPIAPEDIDLSKIIRRKRGGKYKKAFRSRYKKKLPPGLANYLARLGKLDLTKNFETMYGFEMSPPIEVDKHQTIVAVAEKGGGKSTSVEDIAELYKNGPMNPIVLDAVDGGSGENLFWAVKAKNCPKCHQRVPPIAKQCMNIDATGRICGTELSGEPEPCYKCLVVVPDTMRIRPPDYTDIVTVAVSDADLADCLELCKKEKRVLVFGWGLFLTPGLKVTGLETLARWTQELPLATDQTDTDVVFLVREAGTYLFSRMRVWQRTDPDLRTSMVQLVRESRHQSRTICLLDSQRFQDILPEIRSRADRLIIGQQPQQQLEKTETVWLLYEIMNRRRSVPSDFAANLLWPYIGQLMVYQKYLVWRARQEFVLISPFDMPTFHHRLEHEYLRQYGFEYEIADLTEEDEGRVIIDEQVHIQEIADTAHETMMAMAQEYLRPPDQRARDGIGLLEGEEHVILSLLRRGVSVEAIHGRFGVDRTVIRVIRDRAATAQTRGTGASVRDARSQEQGQPQEQGPPEQGEGGEGQ